MLLGLFLLLVNRNANVKYYGDADNDYDVHNHDCFVDFFFY